MAAVIFCEGFDTYTPRNPDIAERWPKQVGPNADSYAFKWSDGVGLSGEFKDGWWIVRFECEGKEPVEVLFNERPTFISSR